uniref:Acyltransferase n=1 Tax=Schlesneria paludicola TaxID=360056 RepID=A0A7C4LMI2_9PLAN
MAADLLARSPGRVIEPTDHFMHLLPHRADIDGLRAVAVLPVVLFHAGLGCPGGYVGVDVFFVISGYLITALILLALARGEFSLADFWQRRVRRIVPALVVMLGATLAAGWFLLLPEDLVSVARSALAQAALISNVHFWRKSGYFDAPAESNPLLHTWSLAVEEQFYLVLPLLLLLVHRFRPPALRGVLFGLCAASFGLSLPGAWWYPSATFYLLPTRAWELLLGSLLAERQVAVASRPDSLGTGHAARSVGRGRWIHAWLVREVVGVIGLTAIGLAILRYDRQTIFPGGAALLPAGGAAAVIWANTHRLTLTGRWLACRPLVFIGGISYSLYLWHWPLLVYARYWSNGECSLLHRVGLVAASLVLAVLSWKYVETPFRQKCSLAQPRRLFAAAGTAWGALALTAGLFVIGKGLPFRLPPQVVAFSQSRKDHAFLHNVSVAEARAGRFLELGASAAGPPELFVWGDSHAMAVLPAVDALCRRQGIRGVAATHSATAPILDWISPSPHGLREEAIPFNAAVLDFVRQHRVPQVLLVARWSWYVSTPPEQPPGTDSAAILRARLDATLKALQAAGARVTLMKEVPCQAADVPRALAKAALIGADLQGVAVSLDQHRQHTGAANRLLDSLARPGVTVVDPVPLFVDEQGRCRAERDGRALYRDEHHLSVFGARQLVPWLEMQLVPRLARRD